ncbi:MAG: putative rRNA maturation factor [Candidatus Daviesbacteria bacterium GW2011_GWB1_39_5]|uniref:Putative rRNA maturation factor n=1 Tax=Candidatus Daviesbacteria bacterium GW2011_GWC2_40_12 TaxID=1618431 RepID=A0A0G0T4D1_9BACT|nr:MAG: putative rRNA maturation factor [Candidatus Daviesbacteria bacterium GW2011_GWF2_38_7]KKR16191.1 MAG: putative rRNA maturation factor [Candidatus Daviesbacteria bacterium GW2011_GWA2_39_33]KKR25070.1 MAG: putative rRNA maturation factor [Candidatus Daviesbacteria bacterium GW2011_GWB1_39_5]KKR41970.1 MAG: putative rRNA maturation factor [Candidatus Daviesbacteria bacterium GW2011_GWC2_40_12]OGE21740.1 MAG: rRNA maturation RNase YbeY [Candidatus Daviesbacteria bacterium RIFCSPHIGHO2_01_F
MVNIIVNADPRYNVNKEGIKAVVSRVLTRLRISGKIELGVNVIGDRKMHELNRKYRGLDQTTNVLSFALEDTNPESLQHIPRIGFVAAPDKWLRLGDIIISYPQALEDASMDGISVDEEIRTLVEHGMNHLLGIHHT